MQDADIPVFAQCSRCGTAFKVSLDLPILARGRRYSLINRRGTCPRLNCNGTCVFLARTGPNMPFCALQD